MFADSSGKFQANVQFQVKVRFNPSNGWHQIQFIALLFDTVNLGVEWQNHYHALIWV